MRTLVPTLALASAVLCAATPLPLHAQRARHDVRRHALSRRTDEQPWPGSGAYVPAAHTIPTRCPDGACDDEDANLAVVAALFPYDDGRIVGPNVITLVVENRGATRAPLAVVDVAPLVRFASVRHMSIGALQPGERTVIEVPVEMGPHGAPCVSITVAPAFHPTQQPVILASAAPPVIAGASLQ